MVSGFSSQGEMWITSAQGTSAGRLDITKQRKGTQPANVPITHIASKNDDDVFLLGLGYRCCGHRYVARDATIASTVRLVVSVRRSVRDAVGTAR